MSGAPEPDRQTPPILFRRLGSRLKRNDFACGEKEIDDWVIDAFKWHEQLKTRVWCGYLEGNPKPAGIYGLRIRLEPDTDIQGNGGVFRSESSHFAAVQLYALGVQTALQRCGIGELMMLHAIDQFAGVADQTGICAMTLVAINADRAAWYEKLGFRRYGADCAQPKMFLPAQTAIEMRLGG